MADDSEEQPNNTGVLGRIGSWLWARSPISSSENASSPSSLGPPEEQETLTEDVFYPVVQHDGQPSGEETAEEEWEEASSSFQSGNTTLDQNAGPLTHFTPEAYQNFDKTCPQEKHAQTSKRLHVYLEETSVSGNVGKEVVCKYSKSLEVRPKSRSSVSLDSEKGSSYSSALLGVSLNSQKVENLERGDVMGRKNARRRYKKNSQGDSAESCNNGQPDKELTDKSKPKSPKSKEDSPSLQTTPAPSPALPASQKSRSSGPGDLNSGQDNSSLACGEAAKAEVASMEADDSFYRVERKTETPESKRRSMKVSKSQIKLFTKNVALQSRAEESIGNKTGLKMVLTSEDEGREEATAEPKVTKLKKQEDKSTPTRGRIADKISLFENRKVGSPRPFDTPRSADVSPVRKVTGRIRAEHALSEQKSRSAECLDRRRSSSSSPPRHKGMTIKERVKNFNDTCVTATWSNPKPNISRIHHKVTASKSLEILDLPEQQESANEKTASKSVNGVNAVASPTETNDANASNDVPAGAGPRNKKKRSKELASLKTEKEQESINHDRVDGKSITQEDTANVALSGTGSELSKENKLNKTRAKDDITVIIGQETTNKNVETVIVSIKNNDKSIPSAAVKPPSEDIEGKRPPEITGSTPQQDTAAVPPVIQNSNALISDTGQVKISENVTAEETAKNSNECDLHNKEDSASSGIVEKDTVSASKKFVRGSKETLKKDSDVPTVKPDMAIQKAIPQTGNAQLHPKSISKKLEGNEQNLAGVKQATSVSVDKIESPSAELLTASKQMDGNVAQQTPGKQVGGSGKLEKAATSGEQMPSEQINGTKGCVHVGPSNEDHKSLSIRENNEVTSALASAKQDTSATSGQLKLDDKVDTQVAGKPTISEQTNEHFETNANLSKSCSASREQKNKEQKGAGITETSFDLHKKWTISESSLQLQKDAATQNAREEKSAQLLVTKPLETDLSNSFDETKTPIDKSPAILPQKDQDIVSQNSVPFTTRTDGLVKDEKRRLAAVDLPASERNVNKPEAELKTELQKSKLQSKQDDKKIVESDQIKQKVIETVNERGESIGSQVLDYGEADKQTEKLEKSFKHSPSNTSSAEKSEGAKNNAFSVMSNEGEGGECTHKIKSPSLALTKSTKKLGKESKPKSAVAPDPQAECVTAEKEIQSCPDDSVEQSRLITADQGVLAVAKNGSSEPKDVVEKTNMAEEGEKDRVGPEKMQLARDLIKQASGEFEKAITNIASGKIAPTNEQVSSDQVSVLPKEAALKDEVITADKQSLISPPQAIKFLDSSQKRHKLVKGRSKDDWSLSQPQDAPSSWLDVDFPKQRLKVSSGGKLTSSGSESNLLDTSADLDDEDFVERIKKLCAPFQLPPRKHNPLRHPQPPFAMPAIKEDRFEKTFDPEEFTFGLRKNNTFSLETPSLLAKLQSSEGKTSIKPARASLADRSMLLSGLDTRFRDKTNGKDKQEESKDEEKDERKIKSRLEGSCVLNSLTTSSFRNKLIPAQTENSETENVSHTKSLEQKCPQQPGPPSLSPTNSNEGREEKQTAEELVVTDSGPSLPTFDSIKLPSFLEKYLPREAKAEVRKEPGQEQLTSTEAGSKMPSVEEKAQNKAEDQVDTEIGVKQSTLKESVQPSAENLQADSKVSVKMPTLVSATVDTTVKEEPKLPEHVTNHFAGIALKDKASSTPAQLKKSHSKKIQPAKGFHKRPGKMLLFEKAPFEGQLYEVHRDMEDATSLPLSPLISVKVVRGCWVLYEKPGFQGRTIALEEGSLELSNVWADPGPAAAVPSDVPIQIGSIRLAVADYSVPHIDLFTEPEGRGRVTQYHDDALETGSFGIPLNTASIQVHSGVWLVFSDPGFQGMLAVLETGVYPFPETWGFPSPFVGSLRPLKMGGFKVENPNEVKVVVYERAGFEGPSLIIETDVFSFGEEKEEDDSSLHSVRIQSVGSLKVHGGLWVGYSESGFEGQQYILEEGEYQDCGDWGGSEMLSIRPIMADFMSPHMKMFTDLDFGKLGMNIDLTVPVINLDETGYGLQTQSMDVLSGVWVVFEGVGFSGESYIMEKGQYGSPEDWGATRPSIASAMPVVLENFENAAKFKVQLFSEGDFQGASLNLEDSEGSLPNGFSVASCKVLAGSWLAFEEHDFSGRMYVLDEGTYPDLRAMGCVHPDASIRSLQIVGFEFSVPSIVLFERSGLKGKRVVLSDGVVNLQMSGGGGRVQSLLVEGGIWVLYEEVNFRGAQVLLRPGEVSDWRSFCHWKKIGSLRPLLQKQVHFRLRNRLSGQLMTVTGDLDDIKLLRVLEMDETHGFEQIWFFQNGHLCCKVLEECCLCPSSSVTIAGARAGLTPALDEASHLWSITPDGFICYSADPKLVLDIKGGHHYDKSQVILNTMDPKKIQQQWHVEVL